MSLQMSIDREAIADVQHEIWVHWMSYLFRVCPRNEDGTVTIPAEKVERWLRQVDTPYSGLSDTERESDRHQADKVIAALAAPPSQPAVTPQTREER